MISLVKKSLLNTETSYSLGWLNTSVSSEPVGHGMELGTSKVATREQQFSTLSVKAKKNSASEVKSVVVKK